MSLASRLSDVVAAIGADVKFLNTQLTGMGGMPVQVIDGGATPSSPLTGFTAVSSGEMSPHEHPHAHDYAPVSHAHDFAASGHGHTLPTPAEIGALSTTGKAADADKLDGLDSLAFLRSDGKAVDADKLDGLDSTAFLRNTMPAATPTSPAEVVTGMTFQGNLAATKAPQSYPLGESVGAGVPGAGWPSVPGKGSSYGAVTTKRVSATDAIQTFQVFYSTGDGQGTAIFQRNANGEGNAWKKWVRLDTDWSPFIVNGNGTYRGGMGTGAHDILVPHTFYGPESGRVLIQGLLGLEINFGGGIADLFLDYNVGGKGCRIQTSAFHGYSGFASLPCLGILEGLTPGATYSNGQIYVGVTSQSVTYPGNNRGAAPPGINLLFTPLSR